jgi:DNA topoisomerase-2
MSKQKTISSKYQVLTDVEHVRLRPGMYVGSIKLNNATEWLQNEDKKFEKTDVEYIPGFMKLFDEIVSNSVDESKRNPKLDSIVVKVNESTGSVSIYDNGGIPVVIHDVQNIWIPELIFSNLRAGSNFDDSEERDVAGTNGVGSTLTNIFSTSFRILTADGKNQFDQTFLNGMSERTEPKIKASDKRFTEITYTPDYAYFGMTGITKIYMDLMRKRLVEIAACNTNLKIQFNGEKIRFRNFKEYAELYVDAPFYERSERWEIAVAPSSNGYQTISYVNSIETKEAGNHVNHVMLQIVDAIRLLMKKKHKVEIKPSDIRNHMMLFVNCTIINPAFSSQTKERLITEPKDFGSTHTVSDKLIKQVFASEIVASILDWIDKKKNAEEKAQLRKLNSSLSTSKILKLIDAKSRTERGNCTLGIFEGMSALSAVRKFRDAQSFGAFPLKGKFLNVSEMKNTEVIKSDEVINLMASIGLKLGEDPENLRYGKVLIYTDADPDGDAIAALLINFFNRYWPELFDQGRIYKVLTPLVVAKKSKEILYFYSNDEYNTWETKNDPRKWEIEYKKGLASLEDYEYEEIIKNPRLIRIKNDKLYKESLKAWFGGDSAPRKKMLLQK